MKTQQEIELLGEVDVEKRFQDIINSETPQNRDEMLLDATKHGFKYGYKQALEDNKKKKYTEEDMYEFGKLVLDTFHSEGKTHSGKDRLARIKFDAWFKQLNKQD